MQQGAHPVAGTIQVQEDVRVIQVQQTVSGEKYEPCCCGCCTCPGAYSRYKAKASVVLGALQLVVAFLSVVFQAAGVGVQDGRREGLENGAMEAGAGIWCSILFLISGGLAVGAAKNKRGALVLASLIMSIVSVVFAFIYLIISAVVVGTEDDNRGRRRHEPTLALGCVLVILAFVEIIAALYTSGIGCSAVCCTDRAEYGTRTTTTFIPAVMYTNNHGATGGITMAAGTSTGQEKAREAAAIPATPAHVAPPSNQSTQSAPYQMGNNWYGVQDSGATAMAAPPQYMPPSSPPTYTEMSGNTEIHKPAPSAEQQRY